MSVFQRLLCLSGILASGFAVSESELQLPSRDACIEFRKPANFSFDISRESRHVSDHLTGNNLQVGTIVYSRLPIFNTQDPSEDIWLFHWANYLHWLTRKQTIEQQLLFQQGDPFSLRILDESERILRSREYLYDARIWPIRICGNKVDIEVVTRDVWTLTPGVSLSRSGGVSTREFLIKDTNLFGRGKRLSIGQSHSVDRSGFEIEYSDSNLLGSRLSLSTLYADNDDGERILINTALPFYALDTRWSYGFYGEIDKRNDELFELGDDIAEFQTEEEHYELFVGHSKKRNDAYIRRFLWGITWQEEKFFLAPGVIAPEIFPDPRSIHYPWFEYQFIEEKFTQVHNLNQIYRTEDIDIGLRWTWRLGWAGEQFGSDQSRIAYSGSLRNGWQYSEKQLLFTSFELNGFWQPDINRSEEVRLEHTIRYFYINRHRHSWFASFNWRYARNLPANQQLLLGGEENLRGYPLRYQSGDRSFLFTVERRYFSDIHIFKIFRIGAAAFVDAGRAWFPGDANSGATGILSNIGIGLRVASSRAETSRVLHLDIAFPLERTERVDRVQFIISGKRQF